MNNLQDMLSSAAHERPVGFDHRDVQQRATARRRRRQAARVGAAGAGLAVLAVFFVSFGDTGADDDVDVASSAEAQHESRLAGRWTALAYSAVVVPPQGVYVQFDDDGRLEGDDGCNEFTAEWEVHDDRLVVDNLQSDGEACEVDIRLRELLLAGPQIGSFDGDDESLELRAGDDFIAFGRDS
jgi:heat shock protein HslJ